MKKRLSLSFVPCLLCLFAAFTAEAVANNLTYAAELGRFLPNSVVTNVEATGEAEMTVTLYGSSSSTAVALWSRRLPTYVERGLFSVELTDAAGFDDGARKTSYVKLGELLDALKPADELWVEVSNVTVKVDGAIQTIGTGALQRGRIGRVPFAVCADRAAGASGGFDVRGDLTAAELSARGTAVVREEATFGGRTVFGDTVTFVDGLEVAGLLKKPTLSGLSSLKAASLSVTGTLKTMDLAVTNANSCTLSTASGGTAPASVTVTDTFSSGHTLTVGSLASEVLLTVTGKLTLEGGATLDWTAGGTLRLPDGAYAAAANPTAVYSKDAYSPASVGQHSLSTLAVVAGTSATVTVDKKTWCKLDTDGPQVVTTVLVPLPRSGSFSSSHGAVTASRKELE